MKDSHVTIAVRAVMIALLAWSASTLYSLDKRMALVEYRLTQLENVS